MKDDSLSDVQTFDYCALCDCMFNINRKHECMTFSFVPENRDSVGKQENVYAQQIWNDAIEAVINLCEENDGYDYQKIRKLKK